MSPDVRRALVGIGSRDREAPFGIVGRCRPDRLWIGLLVILLASVFVFADSTRSQG